MRGRIAAQAYGMRDFALAVLVFGVVWFVTVGVSSATLVTRSCGYDPSGKGGYVRATSNVACRNARQIIHTYYRKGCFGPVGSTPSSCQIRGFTCFDIADTSSDVDRVYCRRGNRLATYASNP
jgi:hypothetical protein